MEPGLQGFRELLTSTFASLLSDKHLYQNIKIQQGSLDAISVEQIAVLKAEQSRRGSGHGYIHWGDIERALQTRLEEFLHR